MARDDPIHCLWVAVADITGYPIGSNEVKWLPQAKRGLEAPSGEATLRTYIFRHRLVQTTIAIIEHDPAPWLDEEIAERLLHRHRPKMDELGDASDAEAAGGTVQSRGRSGGKRVDNTAGFSNLADQIAKKD
jgi:hypothetical protein